VTIKNVVIPWLSGGAVLFGYAAFAWFRQRQRSASPRGTLTPQGYEVAPLSDRLEHVAEELAPESAPALDSEPALPANHRAARHEALFLGRATCALSPFRNNPQQTPTVARRF
jgi:hypothetical protein